MKKWFALFLALLVVAIAGYVVVTYYGFVFAKTVRGEIVKVERVNQNETIVTGNRPVPSAQIFSFAVAIRAEGNEIFTASSEDRQWAVAQPGQCAQARFFPYPPWDLEKAGTYHNARLVQLYDCPKKP